MASRIGKNALERQRLMTAERGSNGAGDEQGVSSALGEVLSTFVNGGLTAKVEVSLDGKIYIRLNELDRLSSQSLQKVHKSLKKYEPLNDADKTLLAIFQEERDFVIFNSSVDENSSDVSAAPVVVIDHDDRIDFASTFEVSKQLGEKLTKGLVDQESKHEEWMLEAMIRRSEQSSIRPPKVSAPLAKWILDESPITDASPTQGPGVVAPAAPSVPPSVLPPT